MAQIFIMWFKILEILSYIAIFQLIILIINLIINKGNSSGRYILIAMFVTFGFFLSGNLILFAGGIPQYKVYHVMNLVIFLSAPLLYLYFLSKIESKSDLTLKDTLHFLPFVLIAVVMTPVVIASTRKTLPFNNYGPVIMGLLFIQNVSYLIIVLNKLRIKKTSAVPVLRKFYHFRAGVNSVNYEIDRTQKLFILFL